MTLPLPEPREIRRETAAAYSQLASRYMSETLSYERFPSLKEEVVEFDGLLPEHGRVLDLGGGSGRDSLLLASRSRSVVLGDLNWPFCSAASDSGLTAVQLEATALPFRARSLAGLLASGILLHLHPAEVESGLREIERVLTVDGVGWISMKEGVGAEWRQDGMIAGKRWFTYFAIRDFEQLCVRSDLMILDVRKGTRPPWFTIVVRPSERRC